MSNVYPFSRTTEVYAFAATSSDGTPVQIELPYVANANVSSYLVQNLGAVDVWVRLGRSSDDALIVIPSVGTPGNATLLPALASMTFGGAPEAWFNAQTVSGTADLLVCGGEGRI